MITIIFDSKAKKDDKVENAIQIFLDTTPTLETEQNMPIVIFQDGASKAYYIKCSLLAEQAQSLCDLDAKLDIKKPESYRANRELLLRNRTYIKMASDASNGREFNDIIVEYNTYYMPDRPLKVWGGQHRISAISSSWKKVIAIMVLGFILSLIINKEQKSR